MAETWIDLLTILISLLCGAASAIAASCVWIVLLIPARLQDRLQAASARLLTWAVCAGMLLYACHDTLGFSPFLPFFVEMKMTPFAARDP